MRNRYRVRRAERGSAFLVVLILTVSFIVLVGAFLSTSLTKVRHVELLTAEASAFNAAESGLNAAIEAVWRHYLDQPWEDRVGALATLGENPEHPVLEPLQGKHLGRSSYQIRIGRVNLAGSEYADVEIVCRGENPKATHTLVAVIRYGRKPSPVFNHAYFINNFGWLWGSGITVNGDVRSNGNFSLSNPVINGDVMASENEELGAAGTVEGSYRTDGLEYYNDHNPITARPSNPHFPSEDLNGNGELDEGEDANGNGALDLYEYPYGYEGESVKKEHQPVIEMPYLGDLSIYRDLATRKKGTVKQGGVTLIDGILGDAAAEPDDIILVGTEENPIVIDGPVVVENDVVIKGYVTGRGTIYTGRNVHVIDDIFYLDGPSWEKPLPDLDATTAANKSKDMLGLAAKGNVILGDYTNAAWSSTTKKYQTPPFTQSYVVDESDAGNGYVSYYDGDGRPMFDGDYRALDGGKKKKDGGGLEDRRFYQSSFSDEEIHALSEGELKQIDAVLYTNHLISGKVGSVKFNGTLVSRDEAIVYHGSIFINYDIRIRDGGYEYIDIYLPREPVHRLLYMGEYQGPPKEAEEPVSP